MVEGVSAVLTAGSPSPLSPAGSEADRLATIWWILLVLGTFVAIVVLAAVVLALFRGRRRGEVADVERTHQRFIIGGGLLFPVVVLAIVAVMTVDSTASLRRSTPGALVVDITGEQWFWRMAYASDGVTTANELRLPVDRPIELRMQSHDVIHSFWVPQLAGKLDLEPGNTTTLRFTPHEVGTFRGECAEFCGLQHA